MVIHYQVFRCVINLDSDNSICVSINSLITSFIIQWVLDDTVIKNGSQLNINNLTVNDSGVYYCMGSSIVGSANDSINITIIPGIKYFMMLHFMPLHSIQHL